MRVHRAWFARLRLVATAIRAVRLACRSPPRVARPAIPPLPAGQVATCAAALPPPSPPGCLALKGVLQVLSHPQARQT